MHNLRLDQHTVIRRPSTPARFRFHAYMIPSRQMGNVQEAIARIQLDFLKGMGEG